MHRYRRTFRPVWFWLVLLAIYVAIRLWLDPLDLREPDALKEGSYRVARVIDGDTLLLESGARVRLQGIDAPETVHKDRPVEAWGPEASRFTTAFIQEAGGTVRLTFGNERIDRYQRHLAFVWDDEWMLNEELVRAGLAHAKLGYRYSGRMKRRLAKAQDEARENQRGIWAER